MVILLGILEELDLEVEHLQTLKEELTSMFKDLQEEELALA